jgi:hypothetical protein
MGSPGDAANATLQRPQGAFALRYLERDAELVSILLVEAGCHRMALARLLISQSEDDCCPTRVWPTSGSSSRASLLGLLIERDTS